MWIIYTFKSIDYKKFKMQMKFVKFVNKNNKYYMNVKNAQINK